MRHNNKGSTLNSYFIVLIIFYALTHLSVEVFLAGGVPSEFNRPQLHVLSLRSLILLYRTFDAYRGTR